MWLAEIQAHDGRPLTVSGVFKNSIFRNIVFSLLTTLGLHIIASIIFVSLTFLFLCLTVGFAFLCGTSLLFCRGWLF